MADSETRELESRIALLQGQIQKHKEQLSTASPTYKRRRSPQNITYGSPHTYHPYRQHNSTFPPQGYRNKTLAKNSSSTTIDHSESLPGGTMTALAANQLGYDEHAVPSWIVTASRNAQIINSAAYDPLAARERVLDPATKIKQQVQAIRHKLSSGQLKQRLTTVDGIQYSVEAGGSKLVRVGAGENALPTPKQVTISGISFLRSKNGNLYRSTIVNRNRSTPAAKAKTDLCKRFSNTGTCLHGPKCPFIHDPAKIAICREFLRTGTCAQGQHCDLSHELTYERVPACVHFIRGSCTKDKCPYPHVLVNSAAPVCRTFTSLGYCSKGIDCKEKHVFECPDYAEGNCHNPKCRLPHIDRAGQLRQQNITKPATSHSKAQHERVIPIKSENLATLDSASDIDSEDEVTLDGGDTTFSQEHDFLRF